MLKVKWVGKVRGREKKSRGKGKKDEERESIEGIPEAENESWNEKLDGRENGIRLNWKNLKKYFDVK